MGHPHRGLGEAVISADRARRFDTLRGAPARPSASAIRTASIPHHRPPSASRTLRTMPAESVDLALPAAGRFRLNPAPPSRRPYAASFDPRNAWGQVGSLGPRPGTCSSMPKICSLEPMAEVRYGCSKSLPAIAGSGSILATAKRIELVTKVICTPGIGGAAWKEHVPSRLHTNVHERGLNFQIRFL